MVSQNQIKTCVQDAEKKNEWRRENKKGNRFSIFENDRFFKFENDRYSIFENDRFSIFENDRFSIFENDRFENYCFMERSF